MGSITYRMCLGLIARGKVDGMQRKLDLFLAYNRISEEEYTDLCQRLADKIAQLEGQAADAEPTNG